MEIIDVGDAVLLLKHLAKLIDIDVLYGQKQSPFIKRTNEFIRLNNYL